jgi:hypothetical protein
MSVKWNLKIDIPCINQIPLEIIQQIMKKIVSYKQQDIYLKLDKKYREKDTITKPKLKL